MSVSMSVYHNNSIALLGLASLPSGTFFRSRLLPSLAQLNSGWLQKADSSKIFIRVNSDIVIDLINVLSMTVNQQLELK